MSTTTRARPQLSEQIDRLDALLDGLAEGLNDAIADAARTGAQAAVREILAGVLADPHALAALRPQAAPLPSPANPSTPAAGRSFAARVRAAACTTTTRVARSVIATVHKAVRPAVVLDLLRLTGGVRRTVGVAAGVGVVAGALTLVVPGWLAAVSGLTGAATARRPASASSSACGRP